MKKVCVILLMLALFGCEEGGGGAGVPVKPPVDGGGGTIPPVDPPVPTLPSSDIQTDAEDYKTTVKYTSPDGSMIARHSKGHHTGDGARILTQEQVERREARKAAWQSLTDEQKAERRAARQAARQDGSIIEHGHRHK